MNDAETTEFLSLLNTINDSLQDISDKLDDIVSWKEDTDVIVNNMESLVNKTNETTESIQEQNDELSQIKELIVRLISSFRGLNS
jgi:peptidoglycan hydrolase CwlO-like protein